MNDNESSWGLDYSMIKRTGLGLVLFLIVLLFYFGTIFLQQIFGKMGIYFIPFFIIGLLFLSLLLVKKKYCLSCKHYHDYHLILGVSPCRHKGCSVYTLDGYYSICNEQKFKESD